MSDKSKLMGIRDGTITPMDGTDARDTQLYKGMAKKTPAETMKNIMKEDVPANIAMGKCGGLNTNS